MYFVQHVVPHSVSFTSLSSAMTNQYQVGFGQPGFIYNGMDSVIQGKFENIELGDFIICH